MIVLALLICIPIPAARAASLKRTSFVDSIIPKALQLGTASFHCPARASSAARTASNRRWKDEEFVAAHRTLPLGSKARVVNLRNGRSVVVEITDRGPYAHGRIIDLSLAAAKSLAMVSSGVAQVSVEKLPVVSNANGEKNFVVRRLAAMAVCPLQPWLFAVCAT